jgi:hypothetical protein
VSISLRAVATAGLAAALASGLASAPAGSAPAAGGAARIAVLAREAGPPARAPLDFAIQDDSELLDHPGRLDSTMAELQDLGFTHVRLSAHWDQLAPDPGAARRPAGFRAASPGAYDQEKWRSLDRAVVAAERHGLQPMVDVAFFAPRWATRGHRPGEARPRNRIDAREFSDFAVAVARRYSGRFAVSARAPSALPVVRYLTLWNEPNLAVFWTPQRRVSPSGAVALDSPHAYRRLIERAYAAVKRVRPDSIVLTGAVAAGPTWSPTARKAGIPAMRFLRELACVDDALRPLRTADCRGFRPVPGDGLSVHPYVLGSPPDHRPSGDRVDNLTMGNLDTLTRLLGRLAARGRIAPALQDVYVTEFGYLTADGDPAATRPLRTPFPTIAPERQAAWETWAHELAWDNPRVRMFSRFLIRDTLCLASSEAECIDWPSGFRYASGAPKPAYDALQASLFAHRLAGGEVRLFGRLGAAAFRGTAAVEYLDGSQWQPVRREDVRSFTGGGADGIFAMRLRRLPAQDFRIGTP